MKEISRIEKMHFYSASLKKEMQALVYLPAEYESLGPLPVLYFLHGRSGDETLLLALELPALLDELIAAGKIKPLIVVCPKMENSRGVNASPVYKEIVEKGSDRVLNLGPYEDYLLEEMLPFIEQRYAIVKEREGRFIGGASAGGYAALHLAFRHPELFAKVGGHMPALELELEEDAKPYFESQEAWERYDPISIARKGGLNPELEVYLDAGDEDEGAFYEGCAVLYEVLCKAGVAAQNHVFHGHHSLNYILKNREKYLLFYVGT